MGKTPQVEVTQGSKLWLTSTLKPLGFKLLFRSKASSQKLIGNLEKRLDVTLYRLGFLHSIFYSRQAILHNKILVNGKFISNGNFLLRNKH